jgi:hypothetical protein
MHRRTMIGWSVLFVAFAATTGQAQRAPVSARPSSGSHRLAPGEIGLDVRDATHPAQPVVHALVCVAELGPASLPNWFVTDSAGALTAVNLPEKRLHLWVDAVGYNGRAIEIDAFDERASRVVVQLTRLSNDTRSEPTCPILPPAGGVIIKP